MINRVDGPGLVEGAGRCRFGKLASIHVQTADGATVRIDYGIALEQLPTGRWNIAFLIR